MKSAPSVTVVIPAFNAGKFIQRAVESVYATGYPALQVVVVDDGSSDETREVVRRLCGEFPACKLLTHPGGVNLGVSASRNLGIAYAESEWVAFLDADDVYAPSRFNCLRSHLAAGTEVDAFYGKAEVRQEVGPSPGHLWPSEFFGIQRSLAGPALLQELLAGDTWHTSAITVKKALLTRACGFDTRKKIAEDCDLWYRIAALGNVTAFGLDMPVSVYYRHDTNTFQFRLEHRLAVLTAMFDAWGHVRAQNAPQVMEGLFGPAIDGYALQAIIVARESGRSDIAHCVLRLMLTRGRLAFFSNLSVGRQILALVFRRSPPVQVPNQ